MKKTLGLAWLGMLFLGTAVAVEEQAGKMIYDEQCADCHFEDDFSGEPADAIAAMIDAVIAGTTKHPEKLAGLSEEDVRKLAAYFASQ